VSLQPGSEAELAEMIRSAAGPLVIRGGGTRGIGRAEGEVLDTGALTGITLHEPGALTLVAGAGTPLVEVELLLAGASQRLAFEPPDFRDLLGREGLSTIGGIAAANASGPRRVQGGAARDHLMGLRFVDGRGEILKNGGRVMKNVTGLDLVKLLAGSQGTLGVITEVSLKVQAIPEAEATLCKAQGQEEAVAAMTSALGSPFDVSGAAHLGVQTLIRIEGMAGSVAYRLDQLRARLGPGWEAAVESAALWRQVRDVTPFAGRPGAVWRCILRPSDAARFTAVLPGAEAIFDWGGGLVWLLTEETTEVRQALARFGGHATLVRGGSAATFPPEAAPVAALSRSLRQKFDPRGILNRGLMG
jgi:glycolate oxidase FAD binding subunit